MLIYTSSYGHNFTYILQLWHRVLIIKLKNHYNTTLKFWVALQGYLNSSRLEDELGSSPVLLQASYITLGQSFKSLSISFLICKKKRFHQMKCGSLQVQNSMILQIFIIPYLEELAQEFCISLLKFQICLLLQEC